MKSDTIWLRQWAQNLHRKGLHQLVAALLDSFAPLGFVGAQMVYLGKPLLRFTVSPAALDALAEMLENPEQMKAFRTYLQEEITP